MQKHPKRIIHLLVTVLIVAAGAVTFVVLTAGTPQLERTEPPIPVPSVRTTTIRLGSQPVLVEGEGTVRPMREIQLVPQVSGKIVDISPSLVDGGQFEKDDLLLRIDPVDYELAVTLAKAKVKNSESVLEIAEEEAAAAREEWRLLNQGEKDSSPPPPLVAKEPQLAAARAQLAADQADLRKALLSLERTEIRAPFNGRVSSENVDIGQYVRTTEALATLFSTEAAEIIVPIEDNSLYWFHVPGFTPGEQPGAPVAVRSRFAGREVAWQGRVVRAEGQLDERTRLVNVVVRVEEPYAAKPPLVSGLFVKVEIQGRTLENSAVLPRPALRENDLVWVVDPDGRLRFREVAVARLTADQVIVSDGLAAGEQVVTSGLRAVTDGMQVRPVAEDAT
jgi:RND family efflux transporter MFP subunit